MRLRVVADAEVPHPFLFRSMVRHAAVLIRVSTDFQKEHGTSLEQQRKDLLGLAASQGYTVSKSHIFDDGGYSGYQLAHSERPGLNDRLSLSLMEGSLIRETL